MERPSRRTWPAPASIPDCPPLALVPIRQHFSNARPIDDLEASVRQAVGRLVDGRGKLPRVGIACGSRGIAQIGAIVRIAAAELRRRGSDPILLPAMGSHGGATPGGQIEVLEHLGVDVTSLSIDASLDTAIVGRLANGAPVHVARSALACDGVLLINRVKAHTDFHGPIESGLAKMAGLGLGKRDGAAALHALGVEGLRRWMPEAARIAVARAPIVGGIAVVEHARHDVAEIHAVTSSGIGAAHEAAVLRRAIELQPRLPFEAADVLVVGRIGKDVSGTGLDTNVIGRLAIAGEPEPPRPRIGVVVALRLTEASGGNGHGMGLADIAAAELVDAVDLDLTYVNSLTSGLCGVQRARIPLTLATDQLAVAAAIARCGQPDTAAVRLAVIRDTLDLDRLWVTAPLLPDCVDTDPDGEAAALRFDAAGRLAYPAVVRREPSTPAALGSA